MRRTLFVAMLVGVLSLALALPAFAGQSGPTPGEHMGRKGAPVTVTVLSSGLSYDSIITAELPRHGRFQQLVPTADGLTTAYGPGDPGYLGGRWWVDANGSGKMDDGDAFFLCPLLGPGS